jgi:hypothetical protein
MARAGGYTSGRRPLLFPFAVTEILESRLIIQHKNKKCSGRVVIIIQAATSGAKVKKMSLQAQQLQQKLRTLTGTEKACSK